MSRKTLEVALVGVVTFLVTLAIWNFSLTQWRLAHAVVPGQYFSVEGSRMYIYCVGIGSPTVVIESGLGSDSLGWYGVQKTLARTTRVCAYDRSGLGLSEPRSGRRDAETIARQFHDLLNQARVEPPLIALGWSVGGLYTREYARQFSGEIVGVALVESSLPHQLDVLPGARATYDADKRNRPWQLRWERLRVWSGWERLMGRCWNAPASDVVRVLSSDDANQLGGLYVAKTCRSAYIGGEMGEFVDLDESGRQAARLSSFGDVPLLIITEDTERRTPATTASDVTEKEAWSREQEALKKLSNRSWRVIARNSGHAVHHDRPDIVIGEVMRLIDFIRGGPAPPFGSTFTQ